ncbi:MAG: VanW family protein [Clostridia bacterium]|nr:VanW family protein [Clostridia bacterium]
MSNETQSTLEDIKIDQEDTSFELPSKKNFLSIILVLVVIMLLILGFSTIFSLLNMNNSKIINGVSINEIDVSNLTVEEAIEKVESQLNLGQEIILNYQDYSNIITSNDIDFSYNLNDVAKQAYEIGRSGNIFTNNYKILFTKINHENLELSYDYSEEKLDSLVKNIGLELPNPVIQPSYNIEDKTLVINNGSAGVEILSEELSNLIISSITNQKTNIEIPVKDVQPEAIDIEKIYSEVHTEPQDAYIERDPFKLHVDVDGIDFAISLEQAKQLLIEQKSEYEIPLKISKANIQVANLGNDLFVNKFSTFTSRYDVSNKNRSNNVELASKKINGVILLPGETFSYNQTVGKRTIAAGFKEASIYTSSGIENGVGGGICQVSSTLYNAVLEANLEIVERKNHSYYISYIPLGKDATVSYGSVDFKFKNSRSYPIKIVASSQNGVCSVSIYGLNEETEYNVSIQAQQIQVIPFQTTYVNDSSLASGKSVVKQNGMNGYKYETYKVVSLNGNVISKKLISSDTYKPLNKVVNVGTGSAPAATPTPTPTPEPSQEPASTPSAPATPAPETNSGTETTVVITSE